MFTDDSVLGRAGGRLIAFLCLVQTRGTYSGARGVVVMMTDPRCPPLSAPDVNAAARLAKQIKHRVKHFVFGLKFFVAAEGQKAALCSAFSAPNKRETLRKL